MPVKGGTKCIKYMLFGFNFIFWVRNPGLCPPCCPARSPRDGDGGDAPGVAFCLLFFDAWFLLFSPLAVPRRREGGGCRGAHRVIFHVFGVLSKGGLRAVMPGGEGVLGFCNFAPTVHPAALHTILSLKLCAGRAPCRLSRCRGCARGKPAPRKLCV